MTCIGDLDGGSEIDYPLSPADEEQDAAVENIIRTRTPEHVAAMSIPGHKNRSIFDRYNIVSDADLKSVAGRRITFYENQRKAIEEKSKSLENRAVVKVKREEQTTSFITN